MKKLLNTKGFVSIEALIVIGLISVFAIGFVKAFNDAGSQQTQKSIQYTQDKLDSGDLPVILN